MRLPDFVVIGAMRSGTTTLSRVLRDMPGVAMAPGKETHFFDDHYARGLDWYGGLFSGLAESAVVGEATPNYMHDDLAMERLLSDLPGALLVAILRNPIDRAWSHYWFNLSREKETLDFEAAIEAEPSRMVASSFDRRVFSYVSRGRYANQLLPLIERAGRGRVHIVYMEDFLEEPASELASLLRFLGVKIDHEKLGTYRMPQVNKYVEFRSVRMRDIAKRLPPPLKRIVSRLNAKATVGYPEMSEKTRKAMRQVFADTVHQTALLVGREPHRWTDWY